MPPKALTVDEALSRITADVRPLHVELVPLLGAQGRILARAIAAQVTKPLFDASAMDGYAVRAADLTGPNMPLTLIGQSAAGHGFQGRVERGQTVRIFTGAPVPEGADTVVIQEDARVAGDTVVMTVTEPIGANVRPAGGDFQAGTLLLASGRRLGSREITLAAASGHAVVPVVRKPIVAILATGDELVPPGETPGRDQTIASNSYGLCAMVQAAGAEPRLLGIAKDRFESLAEAFDRAAGADVLVTIGGASVGDHDLVQAALTQRGLDLAFWQIAMRPGKPLMFGNLGTMKVLGVPGNPVSALICGRVFLIPLIKRMLGDNAGDFLTVNALLGQPIAANGSRQHYVRATLGMAADGRPLVFPLPEQDSSLLVPLAHADCLIVRPVSAPALPEGSSVPILRIDF